MKRELRIFLLVLFLACFVAVLISYHGQTSISCRDCNVVVIGFDALQARHVHHLGYFRDTTPNVDALASEGFTFKNYFTVAPWTVPSFMSSFTSLYPSEHGVVNKFSVFSKEKQVIANLKNLSPNVVTLAQVFKENGYITAGFTGDAGVNKIFGYDQGFDVYQDGPPFGSMALNLGDAMHWIDAYKGHKFFMFFHGYDAHGQFKLPQGYKSRYQPANYHGSYSGTAEEQQKLREEGLARGALNLSPADVEFWRAWYDGKIRDADERVGAFLSELKRRGLYDKTIIVVISDHGTEFFEHKRFDHGFSLYDELLNALMVIRIPGVGGGKIVEAQSRSIDLFPTLLDVVGIHPDAKVKAQMRGKTLTQVLEGKSDPRELYAETDYRDYTHKRALRTADGWKYILTLENGTEELYNLQSDPQELVNLVDREPKKAQELRERLRAHLVAVGQDPNAKWQTGCLPVYADQCK